MSVCHLRCDFNLRAPHRTCRDGSSQQFIRAAERMIDSLLHHR